MKKILILLSIIIFIICDKKSYEKLNENTKKIKINEPKKSRNPFQCGRACPEGTIFRKPCNCVPICENGYYPNGRCKPKKNNTTEVKKCSPGYYYSKQYKRCCKVGIKGGPCGPKKPKPIEFIDN